MAQDLFYIDLTPDTNIVTEEKERAEEVQKIAEKQEHPESTLLLPSHVSVLGSLPVQNIPSPPSLDTADDYIEFLDYGGPSSEAGLVRYFETQEEKGQPNATITVCKRCGAKGEHKTSNCPVIINCPNRGLRYNESKYDDCHRCGSAIHSTHECPTVWRLYEYVSETDKNKTLKTRRSKKKLPLGQGGEGYIAEDVWCYNCGGSGHWGDDCKVTPHNGDAPAEYSAFGSNNLFSGPFADFSADQASTTRHEPQEWEKEDYWGDRVPTNVGKKGRKKEIATLKAQQRDEDDDWFAPLQPIRRPNASGKMKFNIKAGTSLLDRISDIPVAAEEGPWKKRSRDDEGGDSKSSRGWEKDRKKDREKDRGNRGQHAEDLRDKDRRKKDRNTNYDSRRSRDKLERHDSRNSDLSRRSENGPRYRGGYNR
uniref:CCHC-type domain-containing protein n=1 Tax=Moniliophthora roreri TaxID=221103 RepID=A0A0W0FJL9_MONRR